NLLSDQVGSDAPGLVDVAGIPPVVSRVLRRYERISRKVDIIRGRRETWQPAGDERRGETVRCKRQVGDRAEHPEALPEHAPRPTVAAVGISPASPPDALPGRTVKM